MRRDENENENRTSGLEMRESSTAIELRDRPCNFDLGEVHATRGAAAAMEEAGVNPLTLLVRHARGDWGQTAPSDARANDESARSGGTLHSAYVLPNRCQVWLITCADRSHSTFLLPDEY